MVRNRVWRIAEIAVILAMCVCMNSCEMLKFLTLADVFDPTLAAEIREWTRFLEAIADDDINVSYNGSPSQSVGTTSTPPGLQGPPPRAVRRQATADAQIPATLLRHGQTSGHFVLADFNNDGVQDTAILGPSSMLVKLYNAEGSTLSTKTYPLPNLGASIVAADFNRDGVFDLAVIQNGSSSGDVLIMLGKGDGTFGAAKSVSAGEFPFYLVAADLNGDGISDLAVSILPTSTGAGSVGVLIGKGNGSFAPMVKYPVGRAPATIVADDFNNDGKKDLVVLDSELGIVNKAWTLVGRGDGTFELYHIHCYRDWKRVLELFGHQSRWKARLDHCRPIRQRNGHHARRQRRWNISGRERVPYRSPGSVYPANSITEREHHAVDRRCRHAANNGGFVRHQRWNGHESPAATRSARDPPPSQPRI